MEGKIDSESKAEEYLCPPIPMTVFVVVDGLVERILSI